MKRHPNSSAQPPPGALLERYRCPDCTSEVGLAVIAPGLLRLTVRHDRTCPTLRALTGGRP